MHLHDNRPGYALSGLAGMLLASSVFTLAAQASTIVDIKPETTTLSVGERAAFSVGIENAENVYGIELHLLFDAAKLQIIDGDPSVGGIQLLPGDLFNVDQGFLVANQADNQAGTALFAFTLLAPTPPMVGEGTLVQFEVEALGPGRSSLELEEAILASPDGESIPFIAHGSEVMIEGDTAGEPGETVAASEGQEAATSARPSLTPSPAELAEDGPSNGSFASLGILMFILAAVVAVLLAFLIRWGLRRG